jgi:hypothetical protein
MKVRVELLKERRKEKKMKITWISAIAKHLWIIFVVHKILDVSQFMMNCYEVFMSHVSAHFDSIKTNFFY